MSEVRDQMNHLGRRIDELAERIGSQNKQIES